jgi:hypothetical protein
MKDIFEDKDSQHAHDKFIRYSKGVFVGPLLKIRFTKSAIKLSGSFHFTDELLWLIANEYPKKEFHVKGSLIWNADLSQALAELGIKYSKVSKSRGIFKYQLENDVNLKKFMEAMGDFNILLSVKDDELSLSTKPTFPKPNKEFTVDFCKATFPSSFKDLIMKEFAFGVKEKKVNLLEIQHSIVVNDIILPQDAENFDIARREAKRVGTIERKVTVNGGETEVLKKEFKV